MRGGGPDGARDGGPAGRPQSIGITRRRPPPSPAARPRPPPLQDDAQAQGGAEAPCELRRQLLEQEGRVVPVGVLCEGRGTHPHHRAQPVGEVGFELNRPGSSGELGCCVRRPRRGSPDLALGPRRLPDRLEQVPPLERLEGLGAEMVDPTVGGLGGPGTATPLAMAVSRGRRGGLGEIARLPARVGASRLTDDRRHAAPCGSIWPFRRDPGVTQAPETRKPRGAHLAAFLVPRDGVEPPTRGFSVPCSTN